MELEVIIPSFGGSRGYCSFSTERICFLNMLIFVAGTTAGVGAIAVGVMTGSGESGWFRMAGDLVDKDSI